MEQKQKHQRSEAEDFKEFKKEQEEKGYVIHKPKTVFDGVCDHYFIDEGFDSDGHGNASCKKCPMGRFYGKDQKVEDGKITTAN